MAELAEIMRQGEVLSPQEERIIKETPIGLVGEAVASGRYRVHRRLAGFRNQPIRLNVDRAVLFTESFKQTEGRPIVLRWARALANILEKHPIYRGTALRFGFTDQEMRVEHGPDQEQVTETGGNTRS